MPPFKLVPNLSQLSINSLSTLIINAIDPIKLNDAIIKLYMISRLVDDKFSSYQQQINNEESHSCKVATSLKKLFRKTDYKPQEALKVETETKRENLEASTEEKYSNHDAFINKFQSDVCETKFNIDSTEFQIQRDIAYQFVKSLIQELTILSHCGLQEQLFSAILPKLNYLYTKRSNQEMRKLIREIVPQFINPCLKQFDFCTLKMFTESTMFQAIFSHLKEATGLEKLVFGRSCYWRAKCMKGLSSIFQGMKNLETLHIHYICQPEMLLKLCENCPGLVELSLKGSQDITDNEVSFLTNFSHLHTVDISGTSITGHGCRILINSLQNLVWITHCPFNCNSDTLIFESRAKLFNYIKHQLKLQVPIAQPEIIPLSSGFDNQDHDRFQIANEVCLRNDEIETEMMTDKKEFSLNLKSFWLFNPTTEELLLTLLCPQLEHLRLDFVIQDLEEEPDTSIITKISNLSTVYLYMYDRCPANLVSSIVENGTSLTYLHLHLGDEWFFVAPILNCVARCCPNLSILTMEGDYKGQHSLEDSDSRLDFSLQPEGLKHLIEARISGCVSNLRLLHLLIQAPYLRLLHLDGELEWLHDDTFSEALNLGLLLQLQELWFNVSTGVSLTSIKKLLQSQNNLQRIGRLCLMASASKDVYQDLLHYIKKNNLSTELIWVTDQREILDKSSGDI